MSAWESIDAFLASLGLRVGPARREQTVGGTHAPGSLHYSGLARDYGTSDSDAAGIAAALVPYARGEGAPLAELFFSPAGIFYKNGRAIAPSAGLRQGHYDHVHVGLASGAELGGATPVDVRIPGIGRIPTPGDVVSSAGRLVVEGVALVAAGGLVVAGGARMVRSQRAA